MNAKAIIPLVLAVALGLVAAILVRNAIAHRGTTNLVQSNLVNVVVAKADVEPGKELTKEDLVVSKIPSDAAPGQIFADPAQLLGRVPTASLVKGQAILETLLAPAGMGGGLQALIPAGMRALTFETTEYSGVGGMLRPGCRVDVVTVFRDTKTGESFVRTILQNLKITAVGHNLTSQPPADGQPAPPPSNAITVVCTPQQAQIMQLASMSSRPWLVLRSTRDGQVLDLEGTTMAELRGNNDQTDTVVDNTPPQPQAAPTTNPTQVVQTQATLPTPTDAPPAVTRRLVQILRGGSESTVTFVVPNPRRTTVDLSPNDDAVPSTGGR